MNRAYALLTVKSTDEERRTITGIATSPAPDRMGDVIEPLGVAFKNPLPLLLHHDKTQPIGTAKFKKPTADGIEFTASLAAVAEPGRLKDRLDEAWQSIKAGLLTGVSIGFRAIEMSFMKDGGIHFLKTEVLELSVVTVPANVDASILSIKAYDSLPVGSSRRVSAIKSAPTMAQTIAEQITAFDATRKTKDDARVALMNKASADNQTLNEAETEQYDELSLEIDSIDAHVVRLKALDASNKSAATPVAGRNTDDASKSRAGVPVVSVKANVPPGTAFVRMVQAVAACRGDHMRAIEWSKQWKDSTPEVELYLKAAVAPGTTTDATWAGPLAPLTPLTSEFLELLRPATILGKIPGFLKVPFNVSIPSQTGGGSYGWVGQGAPKPVGKLQFGTLTIAITKCAGIVVITEELARNSSPSAESVIRNDMINGIAQFLDLEFIDPAKAPVANVSPGSVTNGVTPITTAGTTPANARTDMVALMNAMTAAGLPLSGAALIMSEANALALAAALNPLGQPLYPGITINGGTGPLGITVVTSQVAGSNVILLNPPCIAFADDGGVTIDVSREASVQMDSAPDNPALATTVLTSLWQNNLVGLRAERFINWKKARAGCVQYTVATYAA